MDHRTTTARRDVERLTLPPTMPIGVPGGEVREHKERFE